MREIKFRGKRVDNGNWVYGSFIDARGLSNKPFAQIEIPDANEYRNYEVDPGTVGQYTGLNDANGVEIYEGDIVRCKDFEWTDTGEEGSTHKIVYMGGQGYPAFELSPSVEVESNGLSHYMADGEIYVIGNIHDNPSLLTP